MVEWKFITIWHQERGWPHFQAILGSHFTDHNKQAWLFFKLFASVLRRYIDETIKSTWRRKSSTNRLFIQQLAEDSKREHIKDLWEADGFPSQMASDVFPCHHDIITSFARTLANIRSGHKQGLRFMPGNNVMAVSPSMANEMNRIGDIALNRDNGPNMFRSWSSIDVCLG